MKKTKINIGAILLIVFVVINVMLSADIMSLAGYGKGYVGTYDNYAEKGAEDIIPTVHKPKRVGGRNNALDVRFA